MSPRRIATAAALATALLLPPGADARLNPLRVITSQTERVDMMIILDTSQSMAFAEGVIPRKPGAVCRAGSTSTCCINDICEKGEKGTYGRDNCPDCVLGHDCTGERPNVDICGDGACHGAESPTTCPADCTLRGYRSPAFGLNRVDRVFSRFRRGRPRPARGGVSDDLLVSRAGSAAKCNGRTENLFSNMMLMKRVLRNVLPDVRTSVRLGFIGFDHFNWTCDYCYAEKPYYWYHEAVSDKAPALRGLTPGLADWLVRLFSRKVTHVYTEWELRAMGAWDEDDDEPKEDFTYNGTKFTILSKAKMRYVGGPRAGRVIVEDAVYRLETDPTIEVRLPWRGRKTTYKGKSWVFSQAYYTYTQRPVLAWKPDKLFRVPQEYRRPQVKGLPVYMGPQFRDKDGRWWVHRRYDGRSREKRLSVTWRCRVDADCDPVNLITCDKAKGRCAYQTAEALESLADRAIVLEHFEPSEDQKAHDRKLGRIMSRLNLTENGGIYGAGSTPLGEALRAAHIEFLDRQLGRGAYKGKPDKLANCRTRVILMLTDGDYNGKLDPVVAAKAIYDEPAFKANPIKIVPISYRGTVRWRLDRIADISDDGLVNGSAASFNADDEREFVRLLRKVILANASGDFATAAPAVVTGEGSNVQNNVSIVASTQYPGWRGHLRAFDLARSLGRPKPGERERFKQLWDAGALLQKRTWTSRLMYTGAAGLSRTPIRLFQPDGTVDTAAIAAVWPGTPPKAADIRGFVEWLAGKPSVVTRGGKKVTLTRWRLGPLFRQVPAAIGPPPAYEGIGWGHGKFEARYRNRRKLIYIASNEGLLHAFDAQSGEEKFAFIPAHLLGAAYDLWKRDGQDGDPDNFRWILANPVRVEDVPYDCGGSSCSWLTQLVLTSGPGSDQLVALDITDPCLTADCAAGKVKDPPFRLLMDSRAVRPAIDRYLGETWSVPAIFFSLRGRPGRQVLAAQAALGSGYARRIDSEGRYYNFFPWINETGWVGRLRRSREHALDAKPKVKPYAVLADTAAAVDVTRRVIATYQADLLGRIARYDRGDASRRSIIVDLGPKQPFYYAPAVLHRSGRKVTLAAITGAFEESDGYIRGPTSFVPRLVIRTESGGTVDTREDHLTCAVNNVCGCTDIDERTVGATCVQPGPTARPTARPLIVENAANANATEAFFLLYEPKTATCGQLGTTWLMRLSTVGSTQTLMAVKKYPNTHGSGLAIVGGGQDVVFAASGKGKEAAAVQKLSRSGLAGTATKARLESWRVVSP